MKISNGKKPGNNTIIKKPSAMKVNEI